MKEKVLWEEEIVVRYVETDHTGIVHHSYIPVYFEVARAGLFKSFTKSYAAIEHRGVFAPVVAYTVEILSPAYYEDQLVVKIKLYDYTGVRLTLSYEIVRQETGETIATGLTTNVFVDEERKPVNIRSRYPKIYALIQQVMRELEDIDEDNDIIYSTSK